MTPSPTTISDFLDAIMSRHLLNPSPTDGGICLMIAVALQYQELMDIDEVGNLKSITNFMKETSNG